MDRAARLAGGGSRPGTASSVGSDDDWRGGDREALDAARQARRERSRSARKKQKERDDKHAPVEEAKEEPAPQSELLDKLHAPIKRCLKQLKEGAEKAVGKPVPFAVETQLNDAVQSLRDICSSYDAVWRSCIAPQLKGDAFEGPYEQLFGHLQEEPGSSKSQPKDLGSTYRWLCCVTELTIGSELRALAKASDAKKYLLWDRIKKGCRALCENAPKSLDIFASQAGRKVEELGGHQGLMRLVVEHAAMIPIIAAKCLEASLVDPPKLTPGTSVEFARGADEILSRGSIAGVSGRTCDIECDGTTVKNVLIDKVRRVTQIPEGSKVGALQKCDIVLRVLKPALEGVDVGEFASFVNGKASIPEKLIAGTSSLVTRLNTSTTKDALTLLKLVDDDLDTASKTFDAASTALSAGVEADVRPGTLSVLLDLVKAAKVASDIEEKPAEVKPVEGDEERRSLAICSLVQGPPLLKPLVDDIINGKLQATRLKQRLEAAKSEAAALGNDDDLDTVELAKKVERALALELWCSRQAPLVPYLKEDPAHLLRALASSKHGLLDVAQDLTSPSAPLWAPMRCARLATAIMHGEDDDFGDRDLKVGQALQKVSWPLPSAQVSSAEEARAAMLKADNIVRGWALRAVETGGARTGDDVADQLQETASRFEARSGSSTKKAEKSHAIKRGSKTGTEKATMESDFWKLVLIAKASVAVRTVVVEDEETPEQLPAWKGGSMPISDEGDAATCMAAEGVHVVGSQPISSSVEFEILMWGGGRLGVFEGSEPTTLEAGYFDDDGWGLGTGGVYRKGKVLRKEEGFDLKSGDKVTVTHEASQKILTWKVNGEDMLKLACRKVTGPVTPCAALLQGSVVRLTYPTPVQKEAPDLEGAAKAAYALDQKASAVLLALEAQSERNEAMEQLCRSVKAAIAKTDYDSAISFSSKVEGLEACCNWLEDELEGEANGPQFALCKRAAPEPAFRGYAIRSARCRENSISTEEGDEAPSKVELRWRALCRAQVRVSRLETLIQEKFREEATDRELEGVEEEETEEEEQATPRVDAYVEFSRECGLPRPSVNEAAALAARFGRGWLRLKKACGSVQNAETALLFPKDPIQLPRKVVDDDEEEEESEQPLEASTDPDHVWGPPEAQVIKAPKSARKQATSASLTGVWADLAPLMMCRSDEPLDTEAISSLIDEALQTASCAAFDVMNALSAVTGDVQATTNTKPGWRPNGKLDLHRDSSAAARSRGEGKHNEDEETRQQTPCERIAELGLAKAVRQCSRFALNNEAFAAHVASVMGCDNEDADTLQQLADDWEYSNVPDPLVRALRRAGFVDADESSEPSSGNALEAPLVNGELTKVLSFADFHGALASERFGCVEAPESLKKLVEARFRPSSKAQGIVVGAFLDWILPRGTGLPLQVNEETIQVDARGTVGDARARISRSEGTLKCDGSIIPKSGDHRAAFLVFTSDDIEYIERTKTTTRSHGFIRRPPPRTKEAMDHAWNNRDRKKPHHWSKLCIAAFLKRKGYDDELIEAFEERAVDGYMLFGRGKESVASLASLEAWGADDPEPLRTDLIKVRLLAEGHNDPTERARVLQECGYDLSRRNGDVVEQAHSGVSEKVQERRAVQRAVDKLKIASRETPLEPTFKNTAMARVKEIVEGEDAETVGALRELAEDWLKSRMPKPKKVARRLPRRPKRGVLVSAAPAKPPPPAPAPKPPDEAQRGVAGLFSFAAARQAFRQYHSNGLTGGQDATWRDACRAVSELVDESGDATPVFLAEFTSQLELDLGADVRRPVVDMDEPIW
jgi:hypothetical protein